VAAELSREKLWHGKITIIRNMDAKNKYGCPLLSVDRPMNNPKIITGVIIDSRLEKEGKLFVFIFEKDHYAEIITAVEEAAEEFSDLFSEITVEKCFT